MHCKFGHLRLLFISNVFFGPLFPLVYSICDLVPAEKTRVVEIKDSTKYIINLIFDLSVQMEACDSWWC